MDGVIPNKAATAEQLFRAGALDQAEMRCQEILTAEPGDATAARLLGIIAYSRGDLVTAERATRQALDRHPDSAAWLNLGSILVKKEAWTEAEECFRRAVALRRDYWEGHRNLAVLLVRQGKKSQACTEYRVAIECNPKDARSVVTLGRLLYELDEMEEAAEVNAQAIALQPNEIESYHRLGGALRRLGRLDGAALAFGKAQAIDPNNWLSFYNLGSVQRQMGRTAEACGQFKRALSLKPDFFEAQYGHAVCLHELERFDEARTAYTRAVRLRPDYAAFVNLGNVLLKLDQPDRACVAYRRAIELRAEGATGHALLGSALLRGARPDEACAAFRIALAFDAGEAEIWHGLALALRGVARLGESIDAFKQAIARTPRSAEYHNNFGNVLREMGQMEGACTQYEAALELRPEYAEALTNLATARKDQGKLEEAIALYGRALAAKPDLAVIEGNLVYAMSYLPGMTLAKLDLAHRTWNDRHAAKLKRTWRPPLAARDGRGKPRIGFVSADFLHHPVGYFTIRLLETLRKRNVDFICYANQTRDDPLTGRFRAAARSWSPIAGLSDEAVADRIRADEVDILFDMSGFTAGNRLLLFARKPSPIQVTWFGYMATTGLEAMDYILADRYHIPVWSEQFYREKVVRLPDSYVCFDPPAEAPDISPLPAIKNGYVTFGSFNVLCKIGPQVIKLWARILSRLPNARLLMKTAALSCPVTRQRYIDMFAFYGVAAERLAFQGKTPRLQHMAATASVDIALDPFPYLGGTTTVETAWMGVPVIARLGELFSSRHSLSHLSSIGLTETVVENLDDYIEKAVELAGDLSRLSSIRATLRGQLKDSPLCDAERFTTHFERACARMWEIYRAGGRPRGFSVD